jgi:16S rRNA (cytosine1402-N4)-methyltransferase
MPDAGHVPVLLQPVLDLLRPQPGQAVLDCTLGRAGHAAALIPLIPGGRFIGLDRDPDNAAWSRARLEPLAESHGVELKVNHANFAEWVRQTSDRFDAVLADLGFASNQMDDAERGFSFQGDGPLDMRLDPSGGTTAGDLVNSLPERDLADLIYRYGEERLSRRIARKIVERRGVEPIKTTGALADLCRRAYPPPRARKSGGRGIHPATRTFQALRIAVNGELEALDTLLGRLPGLLKPNGRIGIISFHSLEDRPVKQRFLQLQQDGVAERLTRKPITAELPEVSANPRSRSAKLRGLKRPGSSNPASAPDC